MSSEATPKRPSAASVMRAITPSWSTTTSASGEDRREATSLGISVVDMAGKVHGVHPIGGRAGQTGPMAAPGLRTGQLRAHLGLATVCGVLFLTFLDNTIVSVTLADIQGRLHAGVVSLQWVVNGYALVFAALMLTGGTLGDLLGRKK